MTEKPTYTGVDLASEPDRTVIILPSWAEKADPEFVAELRRMESVELVITDFIT